MPGKDVILVLTASAGAGHVIAAKALEPALRAAAPRAEVEVVDVLAISNPLFRQLYAGGYLGLIRHMPSAMGWLYDAMDQPRGRLKEAARLAIQNANKLPTTRYLRQRRPSLIINTHFLPAEFVAQMRRKGQLSCPQVTVTTDYETHRMWIQEPTERYYVASAEGQAYLASWGVPLEETRIMGIPVRPGFRAPLSREEARRRCELDQERPVVLLLGGAFGVGPVVQLLSELMALPEEVQVVVIVGRNRGLRARVDKLVARQRRPLRVVGFTERMHEWMAASDLAVSKAGGLTVSESLASGLPLVIMNPIPGQESRNSDYLLEHGAAIKVNHPRLLGYRVRKVLADRERMRHLRDACRALGRPDAAADIAADALTLLGRLV